MPISIIIGNGFSIDARNHFKLPCDPNKPWDWDVRNPYNPNQRLLDVLPNLKKHLLSKGALESLPVYKSLEEIVEKTQFSPIYKLGDPHKIEDQIHNEACHYLRIAYAWYSMQVGDDILKSWPWFQWFQNNWQFVQTILSFNYDLILERVLRLLEIGKVYSGSNIHPPFGNGLIPIAPEVYYEKEFEQKSIIHIAKPHGSSNFTGWGVRQIADANGVRPLYPIEMLMVRDSTLKVLKFEELLIPTSTADIVLPGEWSCWNKNNSTYLPWAQYQLDAFIEESNQCETLMIIGFGYGDPDKEEFTNILHKINKFEKIQIIDPFPNIQLIELLKKWSDKDIEVYKGIG